LNQNFLDLATIDDPMTLHQFFSAFFNDMFDYAFLPLTDL